MGHHQPVHRAGHGDIQQAHLIGFVFALHRHLVQTRKHHEPEFQPLARMHAHDLHRVLAIQRAAFGYGLGAGVRDARGLERVLDPGGLETFSVDHGHVLPGPAVCLLMLKPGDKALGFLHKPWVAQQLRQVAAPACALRGQYRDMVVLGIAGAEQILGKRMRDRQHFQRIAVVDAQDGGPA